MMLFFSEIETFFFKIHLPGIYVDRIVKVARYETPIEKRTLRDLREEMPGKSRETGDPMKIRIARRAAYELHDGMYVNLGE